VAALSKKQLLRENQELREENARLRQEVDLLRQKMDLLIRRLFGRSSEKLDANQLDLFLLAPENEPGKVDASSLEEADPRHEPKARRDTRSRERWPAKLPVVEEIIFSQGGAAGAGGLALDRCGGQRTTRLRTRTVPAPAIGAPQIRAAWGSGSRSSDRSTAA
jgi:Transposase C of IS166 homeodomain